jgi:hypothetical protein
MKIFIYLFILLISCSQPSQKPSTLESQVVNLINKATIADSQAVAFEKLESLGCEAVPFIIKNMEDYRKIHIHNLELKNKAPDAFEGIRHYNPELMVDALAAILNQITGKYFENIYNGEANKQRKSEIAQWRSYLRNTNEKELCDPEKPKEKDDEYYYRIPETNMDSVWREG